MKKIIYPDAGQRIYTALRILRQSWNLKKSSVLIFTIGLIVEIGSSIGLIYAGARLSGLLAAFVTSGDLAPQIWQWFWVTVILGATTGLGFLAMEYAKRVMYYSLCRWAAYGYMDNLTKIKLSEFYHDETRNQINKVGVNYTWQLSALNDMIFELIYGLARFIAITVVVAQIAWWIIPIIALFLLPTLFSNARITRIQWFVWDKKGDQRHVFWGIESLMKQPKSQMEIRSLQAQKHLLKTIDVMNKEFYAEQEQEYKKNSPLLVIAQILENTGPAVAGIVVLRQFLSHTINLERYFFLTGALLRIGGALNAIFGTLSRIQEPLLLAGDYFELIEQTPKEVDDMNAKKLFSQQPPTVEFRNLTFTYPNQEKPVFKNLNLRIESGEHVALVGENGAGKSTLIKLLLRFYAPEAGEILINGQDLQTLTLESWYKQIATLFQEFNRYPFSIADNIEIGLTERRPDKRMSRMAAKFGGVDTFIKKYEHGWDTVLDSSFKKGVEPSGGQWQRVALARAFYRNANVLVLDEPTSAIDAKAEYEIFNQIFDHYKNKTTLIVSHRFSTVRRADRIIVLDKGEILEEGSHLKLMQQKGVYHELFSKQAEGYRD